MPHRPVPVALILVATLIAGSRVGQRVIAQESGARAPTVTEVAQDLARPEVLEQIRAELWSDRSSLTVLQSIPSADALTLTPVSRPLYELRREFWTGRTQYYQVWSETVILVSHGSQALMTVWAVSYTHLECARSTFPPSRSPDQTWPGTWDS